MPIVDEAKKPVAGATVTALGSQKSDVKSNAFRLPVDVNRRDLVLLSEGPDGKLARESLVTKLRWVHAAGR